MAKDQEGIYASENEYAYIADLPPPPLPQPNPNMVDRSKDIYLASKRQKHNPTCGVSGVIGYGMALRTVKVTGPNTHAHGSPRYDESTPRIREIEDPPKYFELDPGAAQGESQSKALTPVTPRQENGAIVPVNGVVGQSYQNNGTFMSRMHKSIHEFSPSSYDHHADDEGENENHKSV